MFKVCENLVFSGFRFDATIFSSLFVWLCVCFVYIALAGAFERERKEKWVIVFAKAECKCICNRSCIWFGDIKEKLLKWNKINK